MVLDLIGILVEIWSSLLIDLTILTGGLCVFRLFTPYCIDYIRRLVYGKDLWDVVEIRGDYKEIRGGVGGAET